MEIVIGDMCNVPGFAQRLRGVDVLFHTAAYFRDSFKGGRHREQLFETNVRGTRSLLSHAYSAGVRRIVHTSSSTVLAGQRGQVVDETMSRPTEGTPDYPLSKILADAEVGAFLKSHPDASACTVLPGWMVGPADIGATAAGQLILDFLRGRLPGVPPAEFSVVDARDVAQAHIEAAHSGRRGERYLVAGRRMEIREMFCVLEEVSKIPAPRQQLPLFLLYALAGVNEVWHLVTRKPVLNQLGCCSLDGSRTGTANLRQHEGSARTRNPVPPGAGDVTRHRGLVPAKRLGRSGGQRTEAAPDFKGVGMNWNRRQFLLSLGASAIDVGCEARRLKSEAQRFPSTFRWGCGSSAFQVEGGLDADGRGESIWDVFAKQKGRIKDGSIPSVTCNSYFRYKDDAALISAANLNSYKFSISWPRVFPAGSGIMNERGMDYYDRLTDALLQRHITPYATLFHWDLPQRLYESGGWRSRDTGERFADYAVAVTRRLGDRLKNFVTINEPNVHLFLGHIFGNHAPGLWDGKLIGPVTHHLNLAQGRAIQGMRAQRKDLTIGVGLALAPARPEGGRMHLFNDFAALAFDQVWAGAFLDPLLKGTYPLAAQEMLGNVVKAGDMNQIHQGCDFIGVNYYSPAYLKADFSGVSFIAQGRTPAGVSRDASGREIDPAGLREVLNQLTKDYSNPRLIVTENGCSDPLGDHAAILNDEFRIHYLNGHLRAVRQAMDNGSRVEGFFVWSLLDNWEWDLGFTSKFGLVAQEMNTGVRTPKKSYASLADVAKTGLLPA